jgi:hypothetical protein
VPCASTAAHRLTPRSSVDNSFPIRARDSALLWVDDLHCFLVPPLRAQSILLAGQIAKSSTNADQFDQKSASALNELQPLPLDLLNRRSVRRRSIAVF